MMSTSGTWRLVRLFLRRDRWWLAIWMLTPAFFLAVFVAAFRGGFPTDAALAEYAATSVHNSAFAVVYGVLRGASLGELVTWRGGFIAVVMSAVSLLAVLRHTRVEEEAGRVELMVAAEVDQAAVPLAAVIEASIASAAMGVLAALALAGNGLAASGAWAYGLGLMLTGCCFAALGALVAQLTTEAGTARTIGISLLGVLFLARGVGDVSAQTGGPLGWVAWLSPISWPGQIRPFSGEQWWVLAVGAAVVVVLTLAGLALAGRRDLGAGLLRSRPGPATGESLTSPLVLAWRLGRAALAIRTVGFAIVGLGLGAIARSIADLFAASPAGAQVLGRIGGPGTVIDQYFVAMNQLLAVVAAVFVISTVLRLRAEEREGRLESLLGASADRTRWAAGRLLMAVLSSSCWVLAAGLGMGLGYGFSTGQVGSDLARLVGAALAPLPLIWMFAGLAFALFGWLPRWAGAAFAVAVLSLLVGWLSEELRIGQWLTNLSVFEHLPVLPGGEPRPVSLVVMLLAALGLGWLGFAGFRRRDLPVG